jgi:hypothetical protein
MPTNFQVAYQAPLRLKLLLTVTGPAGESRTHSERSSGRSLSPQPPTIDRLLQFAGAGVANNSELSAWARGMYLATQPRWHRFQL